MKIFITGSASHLAQALLPGLCESPLVSKVTGIDLRSSPFQHNKFLEMQMDVRDSRLPPLLKGQDALIHMAFVVLRGKVSTNDMFDINVTASQRLFDAAQDANINRMIHLSSASVYGSGCNLKETDTFNPLPGFLYAQHKATLEQWMTSHHPRAVRLRPHIILGPHAQPLLKTLIRQPFYIRLPDPQPLLQCVHESDVADAIQLALFSEAQGAYNLAAPDSFSFKAIIQKHHTLALPLPFGIARAALATSCKWFGVGGEPAWLDGVGKTLTVDCAKARALGWNPKFSSLGAIDSIMNLISKKALF